MCGIAGMLDPSGTGGDLNEILARMTTAITHRGPDAEGAWSDPETGVGLGHRRLAIVDLSPEGRQPMESCSGRYVLVFNGEVYNFRDTRAELAARGARFRGHSDTEVMLAAFEEWGIRPALQKFVGMFAFAVWDRKERALTLARDRLGEKPLYYGWSRGAFLFGSELKSLRHHPKWKGVVNRDALASFMRHNYVPCPLSIYAGISKLPPAHLITIRPGDEAVVPEAYWSLDEAVEAGRNNPYTGTDAEAAEELEGLLRRTIGQQMLADVPLGAFLSGGIDSSVIVALMQAQSARPIRTFTIGFHEKGYNEAVFAEEVSRHLGTEHTELYVKPEDGLAIIPKLPHIYDEPFSDSSQVPTFLVSQMTRQHVTVSLSGDGGDELLGGYSRYHQGTSLERLFSSIPGGLRRGMGDAIRKVPPAGWEKFFRVMDPLLPARIRQSNPADKLLKLAELLSMKNVGAVYAGLMSHWKEPESLVLGAHEPTVLLRDWDRWPKFKDFTHQMMYLDTLSYLPDDIMVKVDRAAMAVSLETRAPFLDHRLMEFAWRLPLSMKVRDGQGKWLLRQVLYKHVPRQMIERPKRGFGVPIAAWLRGPLRDWAEALLDENRLEQEGFLNAALVRKKWEEHLSGSRNWHYLIWDVLMFQAWLEHSNEV